MPANPYEEFLRCQSDFVYFVETYVKINHPKRGLIDFKLHSYQKRLYDTYQNNQFVAVKKFRQGGFTTVTIIYLLWLAMFHNDCHIMVAGRTDREAVHISQIVKRVIDLLPDWLRPQMEHNYDNSKVFTITGNRMEFQSIKEARLTPFTHLMIDEAAFIEPLESLWPSLFANIGDSGKVFMLSSINNAELFFRTICDEAGRENQFHLFQSDYTEHPDFANPEWAKKMKGHLGLMRFLTEFECQYVGKGLNGASYAVSLTPFQMSEDLRDIANKKNLTDNQRSVLLRAAHMLRESQPTLKA